MINKHTKTVNKQLTHRRNTNPSREYMIVGSGSSCAHQYLHHGSYSNNKLLSPVVSPIIFYYNFNEVIKEIAGCFSIMNTAVNYNIVCFIHYCRLANYENCSAFTF